MFRFWRKEYTLKSKFTLTLQPYHSPPPSIPRITLLHSLSGDNPWARTGHRRQHKRELCGPLSLQCCGSQEVRMVGWGGGKLMGRHSYGGGRGLRGGGWIWWQGFSCFAKMVWNNRDIMRLWTQNKYTNSTHCDCWPHRLLSDNVQERENKITDLLTALELVLTPFSQHWTFVKPKVSVCAGVSLVECVFQLPGTIYAAF